MIDDRNRVVIRVPGTSANCGSGFDCLGLATTVYNYFDIQLNHKNKVVIQILDKNSNNLPSGRKNIVWKAISKFFQVVGNKNNFNGAIIQIKNNVPISRGLGSSATAIIAGLLAANKIVNSPLSRQEILNLASEIEGHPDNVAPALLGGITISVLSDRRVQTLSFMPKINLKLIVAIPDFELSTESARKILPQKVSMKDAVFNISRAAMLIAALFEGREEFLPTAFEDALHQPYRKKLISGLDDVFEAARRAGALGVTISGSGSCLIAFSLADNKFEDSISNAMIKAFKAYDINSNALILDIDKKGAQFMSDNF